MKHFSEYTLCSSFQNADTLRTFPTHDITIVVESQEQYILSGSGVAPTSYMIQPMEYGTYINRSVPVSVTFHCGYCRSSSNLSATCESNFHAVLAVELATHCSQTSLISPRHLMCMIINDYSHCMSSID